ncbi:DUF3237 domain-containing protein [Mycolicibacterium palauense]|uniref:DUF3237 domain-containing protein n=1 Tax=Mycolicibacterium palauense TaxID=2034511 RepID=UPI000BFEC74D|nr:DUF3237 domain-containing protein [Mycolicibacterium palauense]
MEELKSTLLFDMTLDIPPGYQLPDGPLGTRVIAPIAGGTFDGPRIAGKVLPGGGDWLIIRSDGVMAVDVRVMLEPNEGGVIYASYGGRIAIPAEVMPQALNPETVENVAPSEYYFRSTPLFETANSSPHAWLNGIVAVGVGRLLSGGVSYRVYAIE